MAICRMSDAMTTCALRECFDSDMNGNTAPRLNIKEVDIWAVSMTFNTKVGL